MDDVVGVSDDVIIAGGLVGCTALISVRAARGIAMVESEIHTEREKRAFLVFMFTSCFILCCFNKRMFVEKLTECAHPNAHKKSMTVTVVTDAQLCCIMLHYDCQASMASKLLMR